MMGCWLVGSGELNDLTVPRENLLLTEIQGESLVLQRGDEADNY